METGKGHGTIIFNENEKKFAIINFDNICAIEIEKTLIFMDEYERRWDRMLDVEISNLK